MNRSSHVLPSAIVCACLTAMGAASNARADGSRDPVAAEALFNTAVGLLERADWAGACSKFQASQELDPAVSTLINLSRCRAHEGKLAEAWYTLQQALKLNREKTGQSDKRRNDLETFVKQQVAALEPRVPRLRIVIKGAPEGVTVTRNGKAMPAAVLGEALPVDPGPHEAVAMANGFAPERRSVNVSEGQTMDIVIELSPAAPAATSADSPENRSPVVGADRDAPDPGRGRRTAGFVIEGIGVAGLAAGGVLGVLTVVKAGGAADDASGNADRDSARATQAAAFVTAGVGLAALGAGIALVLTAPKKPTAPKVGIALGTTSVSLVGAW